MVVAAGSPVRPIVVGRVCRREDDVPRQVGGCGSAGTGSGQSTAPGSSIGAGAVPAGSGAGADSDAGFGGTGPLVVCFRWPCQPLRRVQICLRVDRAGR